MAARLGLGPLFAGAAAGAYGMQQANSAGGWANLWGLVPKGPWDASGTGGASGSAGGDVTALRSELSRLSGLVSELARSGSSSGRPTVVHLGGRGSGWAVLVYPAVAGGACLYVYCRVTGTGVMDLLFVSRSSMAAFRNTVQEGLANLWAELRRHKEELVRAVAALGTKQDQLQDNQDQLLARQQEMQGVLRRVDDNVDGLDAKANHTITHVDQMDGRLQDVHVGVQAANQGIYMLMSVVSEVTSKIGLHNSRATQSLHRYLAGGPAWGGSSSTTAVTAPPASASTSTTSSRSPSEVTQGSLSLPSTSYCSTSSTSSGAGAEGRGSAATALPTAGRTASSRSLGGLRDLMQGDFTSGVDLPRARALSSTASMPHAHVSSSGGLGGGLMGGGGGGKGAGVLWGEELFGGSSSVLHSSSCQLPPALQPKGAAGEGGGVEAGGK